MEAREKVSSISTGTTSTVQFGSPHYVRIPVKDSQCSRGDEGHEWFDDNTM